MAKVVQQILRGKQTLSTDAFNIQLPTAKRVAAYCRVSTDMEAQKSSLETQMNVFRDQISQHPGWVLVDIYADQGVSGGTTTKRPEFQRMLQDCENGKIDYIITKSISRFARNTLECLSTIRHLQSIGVQLLFEKENIDTGSAFSEMLLTILAAFAQEESRSISENQKWAFRKQFAEGRPRWHNIYGYRQGENGEYIIIPEQAKVLQEAFARYEHGESCAEIARAFDAAGYPTPMNRPGKPRTADDVQRERVKWDPSSIHRMLTNEKFMGGYLMQKRYVVDHMTRKEVKNDQSVIPSYYVQDHHEGIVSRKQFERVNKILVMKNLRVGSMQYPFDDKLVCPICGYRLIQRKMEVLEGRNAWRCDRDVNSCGQYILKSKIIEEAVLNAYKEVDMNAVHEKLASRKKPNRETAQMLLDMKKKYPQFRKVDYYWVDDLIDRITFDKEHALSVHWKCGVMTTVQLPIRHLRENPIYAGGVYLKRIKAGTLKYHPVHAVPAKKVGGVTVISLSNGQE